MRKHLVAVLLVVSSLGVGCGSEPDCPPATEPPPELEPAAASDTEGSDTAGSDTEGSMEVSGVGGEPIGLGAPPDGLDDGEPPAPPTAGPDAHGWAELRFVDVEDAFGAGTILETLVDAEGPQGMMVRATARGPRRDVLEGARFALHLPDGTVLEPGDDPFGGLGLIGNSHGPRTTWMASARFPWQANRMDEAWVAMELSDGRRFWLEVPYGFVRDPSLPLPEDDRRSEAELAPAMASLEDRDHLVPFRHARYDVGEIQNGWRLEVLASNPFDPHVELILYRDDGGVGQSVYRWSLVEPPTDVRIAGHVGGRARSRRMLSRLHQDGLRRSDHFHVFRRDDGRRGWGTILATVGEEEVEVRVPSSLYLYTHGTADPYHARRVATAAEVLGGDLF